jgi:hypothetical protein
MLNIQVPARAISFIVPGRPEGYRATVGKWCKLSKQVMVWNAKVRDAASQAGLECPLFVSRDDPLCIVTCAVYPTWTFSDPQNVSKALIDALFWIDPKKKKEIKVKGQGDKYVCGVWYLNIVDKENPHTKVWCWRK